MSSAGKIKYSPRTHDARACRQKTSTGAQPASRTAATSQCRAVCVHCAVVSYEERKQIVADLLKQGRQPAEILEYLHAEKEDFITYFDLRALLATLAKPSPPAAPAIPAADTVPVVAADDA